MITVCDVLKVIEAAAPLCLAKDYDNPGFLVGCGDSEVKNVLVALDITDKVIDEAISVGAELIVAHHPIIFSKLASVTDRDITGSLVMKLCKNNISAICMHTNLDAAKGGVNDILAEKLGVSGLLPVESMGDGSIGGGRYGELSAAVPMNEFLVRVCKALETDGVRYHDSGRSVRKVAVGGGSCGEYITLAARLGCDTVVTADIKHNQFLDAEYLGINAIDAGHFATEAVVCSYLCGLVSDAFPSLDVRRADSDVSCTKYFKL